MTTNVLITGAGGHLGGKLFDHLAAQPEFDVSGLDLFPGTRTGVHKADFGEDGDWIKHLSGIDTIVHLAGDRAPDAAWESAIRNNIDGTARLYHHAVQAGVSRMVFASSNWLHGGYRFGSETLIPSLAPKPVNAYGVSKLCGERLGAYFSEFHGLSVICMRIGWTQWTHDNRPGAHMEMGQWGQDMWLSDRDYLHGMTCAITAQDVDFAILNLMSDNVGMRWDIEPTKRVIGYDPRDSHTATVPLSQKLKAALYNFAAFRVPGLAERWMGGW
ncbi:NAD-dependent epimerase/dehydratase family protein [Dinoroseobacter sp. S124A]|uniref:NAD-dependent epimerase/dehydratase family protein n=1 Tax=Dinoroseobacter sp. S124A TaxID=3415128 RepID=UPI003C79DF8D